MLLGFYFLLFVLMLVLFFNPLAIYYTVVLLGLVFLLLGVLFYMYLLVSFLPLVLIMVYLGAMMIMLGYVCAVTPNVKVSYFKQIYVLVPVFLVVLGAIWPLCVFPLYSGVSHSIAGGSLASFFYSYSGFGIFVFIAFLLLFLLLSASFCVPSTSTIRAVK